MVQQLSRVHWIKPKHVEWAKILCPASSCRCSLKGEGRAGKPTVLLLMECPWEKVGHRIWGTCTTPVSLIWHIVLNPQTGVSTYPYSSVLYHLYFYTIYVETNLLPTTKYLSQSTACIPPQSKDSTKMLCISWALKMN